MAIAQAAIGNTDTVVLTVPASTSYAITTVMVCNHAGFNSGGSNDTSFDYHYKKVSSKDCTIELSYDRSFKSYL